MTDNSEAADGGQQFPEQEPTGRNMSPGAAFAKLFRGYDQRHGRFEITGRKASGKIEGRARTVDQPPTLATYEEHLEGRAGIGIIPLAEDGLCYFAAIDVDKYNLSHAEVAQSVKDLPLIVTESKSGGVHLWLFVKGGAPAALVVSVIKTWAGQLGFGGCEIFPKQTERASPTDVGNWINLPYFGDARRCVTATGDRRDLDGFLSLAYGDDQTPGRRVSAQWLEDVGSKVERVCPKVKGELLDDFTDGPPCFQTILRDGVVEGTRNNTFFSFAAYLLRKYEDPDLVKRKLYDLNAQYEVGLDAREIDKLVTSAARKGYHYKCKEPPLKEYCQSALCVTRQFGIEGDGKTSEGRERTSIVVSNDDPAMAKQAWSALGQYEVHGSPAIYRFGDMNVRIDGDQVQVIRRDELAHDLARATNWVAIDKSGERKQARVPQSVITDMMASRKRDLALPKLMQIARVPTLTRDGTLVTEAGYHPGAGIYLAPDCVIVWPRNISEAKQIIDDLLFDFPFDGDSDKAHAIAMLFNPFAMNLYDGLSPLFFVNKPSPGTGASLLVETCGAPYVGQVAMGAPTNEQETEKRIGAQLLAGNPIIVLDNINSLDSPSLASATTAELVDIRVLGASDMRKVPNRSTWIATGNNPTTTKEIARRCLDIRLDACVERPEDRSIAWRIPDLKGHIKSQRGRIAGAILTILKAWVDAGRPLGERSKASYEGWSATVGGVLEFMGVNGFLQTPDDRRVPDPKEEMARGFVACWANRVRRGQLDKWMPVRALVPVADEANVELQIGQSRDIALGYFLRGLRGKVFEFETTQGRALKATLHNKAVGGSTKYMLEVAGAPGQLEVAGETPF